MKTILTTSILCGMTAASCVASAQQVAHLSGKLAPTAIHGTAVHGYVEVVVPVGFHIYNPHFKGVGVPTSISLESGKGFHLVYVGSTKAHYLTGDVKFPVALKIGPGVHGKQKLEFAVRFQQCNDRICLPPVTREVTLTTLVK